MKRVFILLLVAACTLQIEAQHLIGLSKDQIDKEVKKLYQGFVLDNSSVNQTYKYLKYINKFDEKTLLVFLTDGDTCKSTRLMCDYTSIEEVKADLNKRLTPAGKNQWIYSVNKIIYKVTLKREEWFFTVFTKKKD